MQTPHRKGKRFPSRVCNTVLLGVLFFASAAAAHGQTRAGFDGQGYLLIHGVPRFLLGVYDSGGGYSTDHAFWEDQIFSPAGSRGLQGFPLNMYLNYVLGGMPIDATNALLDVLNTHGLMYLQTGNCSGTGSWTRNGPGFFSIENQAYVQQFAQHTAAAGYYIADECAESLIPETQTHSQQLESWDPQGLTFAALVAGVPPGSQNVGDPALWVDAADVLGTDPYPLYGPEPSTGYAHFIVADFISKLRAVVPASRPVWGVLQFFQFTTDSRLPTPAEMRAHAVMAIVEGAQGLFWWDIGVNGLRQSDAATVAAYMGYLKTLTTELAGLEPALLAAPSPGALVGNSTRFADPIAGRISQLDHDVAVETLFSRIQWERAEKAALQQNPPDTSKSGGMLNGAANVRTRTKVVNDVGYVFAYNYRNDQAPVTFIWQYRLASVTENKTGQGFAVSGASWSDTLGPYEARIYVVTSRFFPLTVNREGSGTGTVTSSPAGIDCGSVCSASFGGDSTVTLTATANAGSIFAGWTGGGCSGTGSCTVTMSNATTVSATFNRTFTLSVALGGSGSGTVTSSDGVINCGSICSETVTATTPVTLTAVAASNSTFTGWSGGGCSGTGNCAVTVTSDTTVAATFTLRTFTLAVAVSGLGAVTSSDGHINCGSTCSEIVSSGTPVTLTAVPGAHSSFAGWTGCPGANGAMCVVTVTADTTVAATFTAPPTATTGSATEVRPTSTTLNGTVNPNGAATTVVFQWGLTTSYGNATAQQPVGSGTAPVNVAAKISGLAPTTTYHYRVVATNSVAATAGLDAVFTSGNPTFGDVSASYSFFPWIESLVAAGVTSGCSSSPPEYCPEDSATRGQMAVFLLRSIHGSGYGPPAATGIFADVPTDYIFANWIEQLAREGITGGCSASPPQYCPEDVVTRGQMAVFLLKAKHGASYQPPVATGTFADVPPDYIFVRWIEQLAREGITGGCSTSPALYCPEDPVTRGQMAVFLVRAFNLPM
jgi:hypothetical protein